MGLHLFLNVQLSWFVKEKIPEKGEGLPKRPLLLKDTCLEFVYLKNLQPDGLIVSEGGGEGQRGEIIGKSFRSH